MRSFGHRSATTGRGRRFRHRRVPVNSRVPLTPVREVPAGELDHDTGSRRRPVSAPGRRRARRRAVRGAGRSSARQPRTALLNPDRPLITGVPKPRAPLTRLGRAVIAAENVCPSSGDLLGRLDAPVAVVGDVDAECLAQLGEGGRGRRVRPAACTDDRSRATSTWSQVDPHAGQVEDGRLCPNGTSSAVTDDLVEAPGGQLGQEREALDVDVRAAWTGAARSGWCRPRTRSAT